MNYLKYCGTYNLQNPVTTTKFKAIINCIPATGIWVFGKCATLCYRGKG
jgi:hypothetical protein